MSSQYADGSSFEGQYRESIKHGHGLHRFGDASFYEGQYIEGVFEGNGLYVFANGAQYNGEWVGGTNQGRGAFRYADGYVFNGEWRANAWHGIGTLTHPCGMSEVGHYDSGAMVSDGVRWNAPVGLHVGISCDECGMAPLAGIRYHKRGADYDLCEAEFAKLLVGDRGLYEAIPPPLAWRVQGGTQLEGQEGGFGELLEILSYEEARALSEGSSLPIPAHVVGIGCRGVQQDCVEV